MELLEELVVPVNPAVDIMKCKATVRLNVTDSGAWGPSLKNDGKWNAAKSQMIEVFVWLTKLNYHYRHDSKLLNIYDNILFLFQW